MYMLKHLVTYKVRIKLKCTFLFSVPIVPNFILKLEKAAEPIQNPIEEASEIKCENRTILNDNQANHFNSSFLKITTQSPKDCKKDINETALKIIEKEKKAEEYLEYGDANVKAGIMFGSKALVQMLFNPFVGPITNR